MLSEYRTVQKECFGKKTDPPQHVIIDLLSNGKPCKMIEYSENIAIIKREVFCDMTNIKPRENNIPAIS